MLQKTKLICLLLVCSFAFSACFKFPKPEILGFEITTQAKQELITESTKKNDKIHSVRVVATAHIQHANEVQQFKQVVVYRKPGNFRLESFPIGAAYALNIIVASNGKVSFVDNVEKKVSQGLDQADFMASITTLPLVVDDFAQLIIGGLPQSAFTEKSKIYLNVETQLVQIVVGDFSQYYLYDLKQKRLLTAEFNPAKGTPAKVNFEYQDNIPSRMTIDLPRVDTKLKLNFERVDLNPNIKPELFVLRLPNLG